MTDTVTIINCRAYGKEFEGLTPGSVHKLVACPKEYKSKYDEDVWVMGATEPVRLLPGEYR